MPVATCRGTVAAQQSPIGGAFLSDLPPLGLYVCANRCGLCVRCDGAWPWPVCMAMACHGVTLCVLGASDGVCVSVCLSVCLCVCVYVCTCVCSTCVCTCVRVYV